MRILIVDDDAEARSHYESCFAGFGFDLTYDSHGQGSLDSVSRALADDAPFSVAFVDVTGSAFVTARHLRALDPDLQLVAVTNDADFSPAGIGGPIDKLFHIAKPAAPNEVLQMATALGERWTIDRDMIAARAHLRAQVLLLEERRSELVAAERRAVHSATHDSMTGAPNRVAFLEALEARVKRPGRFATAMFDLDRFKLVNDTLGHLAGDALIREICAILQAQAPGGALVARLGGDEFAMLVDVADEPAAQAACARMIAACAVPIEVLGSTVQGGASAGVVVADGGEGGEPIEFVRRADRALNEAKRRGRGGVQVFDHDMDEDLRTRRRIETELREALANGELRLDYQPIVERDGLAVEGLEALLRWDHPEHGTRAPADFLAAAEDSSLVHALGDWVLTEALSQAARWPGQYVAVNVSPRQFRRLDFATHVAACLAGADMQASRLQIEVTAAAIAEDPDRAAATLRQLRAVGVRVALDDFGTGSVDLGSLRNLALDAVKIDRSFVHGIGTEHDGIAFVHALAHLGRAMEFEVVAEGVETAAQVQALRIAGVSHLQGRFIAAPAGEDTARALATADGAIADTHELQNGTWG